ncbi:MAG: hypothetical protein R3D86_08670 [Emcibacteraceae bacterium]
MISVITSKEIVKYCRSVLGINKSGTEIDEVFLASMIRRLAGYLCPCSPTFLSSTLGESLRYIVNDFESLKGQIEDLINDLVVSGDLLDLNDVTTKDTDSKRTCLFAAPPAFVERKSGNFFLTGIVPDQDEFLSKAIFERLEYYYTTRMIKPHFGEDLANKLLSEGLNRLTTSTWLKAPQKVSSSNLLSKSLLRISAEPKCGPVSGIEIIDPSTKVTYYRGRWKIPIIQSGIFVARRPQEFGSPLWCLVELEEGNVIRLLDLPNGAFRWRGCDAAWHLQMAIDKELNKPQIYKKTEIDNSIFRIEFFSPIPLWAERRLLVLGNKCKGENSLFAYQVPNDEINEEEEFLQENLWLSPSN